MEKNPYDILGVEKTASAEEIKRAFRALAHKYHPDKPTGDEAKFKEINGAYQILSDEKKRTAYDQFGSAAFSQGGGAPGGGFGGFDFSGFSNGQVDFGDLGDMFGDLFGFGGNRERKAARGKDIQIDADLSFLESVFGIEKEVKLTKTGVCERCGATGAEPETTMKTCSGCAGEGVRVTSHRTILGVMQNKTVCPDCHGQGEIPQVPCTTCKGTGVHKGQTTLKFSIPAGVENGAILRLSGQGEAIKGGAMGDLYVRIHVADDARFERHGYDIYSRMEIGFTQAALGDTVEVETVHGPVDLTIPAGTQSHTRLTLRGKGIPASSRRGDHIILVEVLTPKKLSKAQKKLLEELDLKV